MENNKKFKTRLAKLCVNNLEKPLLIDDPHPVFSWQMVSCRTGARQIAYQIRLFCGSRCYWDSGRVVSSSSICIEYPKDAPALKPETDYLWRLFVWDETGTKLEAESIFSTGFMGNNLSVWHGAQWIGPTELSLSAETLPVFRLQFQMHIADGGSSAGIIFGANDPRLTRSTQNNYLICGENYIAYRLDVSRIPAVVAVSRKGYMPGEEEEHTIAAIAVPETVIHLENRYQKHTFEIVVSGNQMEVMTIDGHALETDESDSNVPARARGPQSKTHLVLNPLNQVMDVPIYPRLCQVGFTTASDTVATFTGYTVRHYGGEQNAVFGAQIGATYRIFDGREGLTVEGDTIHLAAGKLHYADPSFGSTPMLRKTFSVDSNLLSARLYAAARGIYEASLNGERVGHEFLKPGDMDFRRRILYTATDVTQLLSPGENALGVTLASGWYGDQTSYTIEGYNFYGDRQAFLAVLALRYADGHTEYIVSDSSWQYYGEGPVRYAGNFNGETYDATREAAVFGWDRPGFSNRGWTAVALADSKVCGVEPLITAKLDPGVRQVEQRCASFVSRETRGKDGSTVYIYDMGVNMVGIPRIIFPDCQAGQKVTIRYAEMLYPRLDPANPYYYGGLGGLILTENLRGALATDHYVMKGEAEEVFMPLFTFHGYRYLEISGISQPIPAENIQGLVLSSVCITAHYESSEPLVNQLFQNILRSTSGNHLSIPTDCPQRDERLGWAGDANVYAETATYMADMRAFYSNYNQLQRDAQGPDGTFHLFVPSLSDMGKAFALGYTWNAAGIMIPFETWLQYADSRALKENYPHFKRHIFGMMEKKAEGREYLTGYVGILGDHLAVEPTDASLMDNAQFYRSVRCVQKAAEILHKPEDAALLAAYANGLQREWNSVFLDEERRTQSAAGIRQDTQASYALPLICGVFTRENEPYAHRYLEEACRKAGYTMTTGFMGTGPLLPALSKGGGNTCAYWLFEQTDCPSWLYPVLNGATSVWERWNSYTIENGFGGQNHMNSFNHYALGAIGSWMMEYQAGIQRGKQAGFQDFILQPVPGGHFRFLKASYDSVLGTILSSWTAKDGILTSYDAAVPANTSATLYLPVTREQAEQIPAMEGAAYQGMVKHNGLMAAAFRLVAGSYHFIFPGAEDSGPAGMDIDQRKEDTFQ